MVVVDVTFKGSIATGLLRGVHDFFEAACEIAVAVSQTMDFALSDCSNSERAALHCGSSKEFPILCGVVSRCTFVDGATRNPDGTMIIINA